MKTAHFLMCGVAASAFSSASFGQTIPFPVATHPRLWVTSKDVSRLRTWAVSTNPIYSKGMGPLLAQAVNIYKTQFFPGGVQNPNYPDPGDVQGYTGYLTEQYGAVLAFNSVIDPSAANRSLYAQYARNMLMVAMNQAALGHAANLPFRDPAFAIYNRANGSGEQWPLIVDWIYSAVDSQGKPILTKADKATIRKVFMMWSNDCLNASTTGGDHPEPIGTVNSLSLLPGNLPYRMASNNYYLGHGRLLTMMALSIDPADDPAIDSTAPLSKLGNSLRSYILDANGAWLYQTYAMMGEPRTVVAAYGIGGNGKGFGLASGGLPPEGMLYGHSFAYLLGQLLALQTAGFNNANYSGPQIALIGAPVWDRYVTGYLTSMTPAAKTIAPDGYLGPVYQFGSYGDLLRLWVTQDVMQSFALLALLEQENGKNTHFDAARWMAVNGVEGGAGALYTHITNPWSWSSTQSILYFMLMDPSAPSAADPRPNFPTVFYDGPAGRIAAHSDWSASATLFDYRASWESINHQDGDGGQFELYRNGEWLTKEMSNYDNNAVGLTTKYHNTLAIKNWSANGTPNLSWFEGGEWNNGSQWMLAENAGDPSTSMTAGPGYVYANSTLTNLYNKPDIWDTAAGATDVTQATRSILWLNKDFVVIYDRASTLHAGLFKRFNLCLVNNPAIAGHVATETMASGQKLFVQSLLPLKGVLSSAMVAGDLSPIAELEPTRYLLTIQDPANPTSVRFLHVLQGADRVTAMVPATYVWSTSGTVFDGSIFGSTAVYFKTSTKGTFAATVFPVSAGVHALFVSGLVPRALYSATVGAGSVTVAPGGVLAADNAGLLRVSLP